MSDQTKLVDATELLDKAWDAMNEKDRKEVMELYRDKVIKDSIKISQMVEDGRLSSTNGKKLYAEMMKTPTWITYWKYSNV